MSDTDPSFITKSDMATPGYFLFRPWSHTDKRHILKIVSGPQDKEKHLNQLGRMSSVYAEAQRCLLEPMTSLDFAQVCSSDTARTKRILKLGEDGITQADLQFLCVSWTPKSPQHLKVESRPMIMRRDAYQFSLCEQDNCEDEARKFFVMTFLDPATANISP